MNDEMTFSSGGWVSNTEAAKIASANGGTSA